MAKKDFTITWDTKELLAAFKKIPKVAIKSLARSLFKEGEGIMAQS